MFKKLFSVRKFSFVFLIAFACLMIPQVADAYDLHFDAQGGEPEFTSIPGLFEGDTPVNISEEINKPTREGYLITGWSTGVGGTGTQYLYPLNGDDLIWSNSDPYPDVTLYAIWEELPTYTVTFDVPPDANPVPDINAQEGSTVTVPTATRLGWYLDGWNTNDLTPEFWLPNESFTMPGHNVSFESNWLPDEAYEWTLSFNLNGWGDPISSQQHTGGTEVMLPSPSGDPGFIFIWWEDSSSTNYNPGELYTMPFSNATLTAYWEPDMNDYTLSFDAQGGSFVFEQTTSMGGEPIDYTHEDPPVRAGYSFIEWNTQADGNGDGYILDGDFIMPFDDVTLYAIWEQNTYTISFDSQGGSSLPDMEDIEENQQVFLYEAPDRAGFNFIEWNTQADGNGDGYGSSAFFTMPANNVTLYAIWEAATYTLRYSVDTEIGETGTISGFDFQTVEYGEDGEEVTVITNPGYTFIGWNDGVLTASRTDTNVTEDIEAIALFEANEYTITFDTQGGSSVSPQSFEYKDSGFIELPEAPTREGYTFLNWNTQANGEGDSYDPADEFPMPTDDVTIYAIWEQNIYTLSFDSQGGSPFPNVNKAAGETVTLFESSRDGYAFLNWNTAANGSGTPYLAGASFEMPANNVTLYAIWEINEYTLTYTAGVGGTISGTTPQTVEHGSDGSAVSADPNTGYVFTKWSDDSTDNPRTDTNVSEDITVEAEFELIDYTLSFDTDGGTPAIDSETLNYQEEFSLPSAPTKTGYTFQNWNTQSDGDGTAYSAGATYTMPASDATLYAIWDANQYLLSFDSQGGDPIPPVFVDFDNNISIPAAPTRDGYTFLNWNTQSDGSGTEYQPLDQFTMPANNVTLYAIWEIETYTLTYSAGTGGSIVGDSPQFVSYGEDGEEVVAIADPGYSFVEWNDGVLTASRTDTEVTGDITVEAEFEINEYTLSFDTQGGSSVSSQEVEYNASINLPAAPARSGYVFLNWNTAANGSGTPYAAGASYEMPANNVTLYAIWEINEYTLNYSAGVGGTITGNASQTVEYGNDGSAVSADPDTGYAFTKWSDDNTDNPRTDTNVTENINVTAEFELIDYTLSFDTDGGTPAIDAEILNYQEEFSLPSAPTKTGYTFQNWNTQSDGSGTAYSAGATYTMPADDVTLYAIWEQDATGGDDEDENGGSSDSGRSSSRSGSSSVSSRVSNLFRIGNIQEAIELLIKYPNLFFGTQQTETQQINPSSLIVRDLELGMIGDDVVALQRILNSNGYMIADIGAGSPGSETDFFGGLTRAALARYQTANGIVPAAGYFGPVTRTHMKNAGLNGVWW